MLRHEIDLAADHLGEHSGGGDTDGGERWPTIIGGEEIDEARRTMTRCDDHPVEWALDRLNVQVDHLDHRHLNDMGAERDETTIEVTGHLTGGDDGAA